MKRSVRTRKKLVLRRESIQHLADLHRVAGRGFVPTPWTSATCQCPGDTLYDNTCPWFSNECA